MSRQTQATISTFFNNRPLPFSSVITKCNQAVCSAIKRERTQMLWFLILRTTCFLNWTF